MQKLATYWHSLKLSLTDPEYYYTLSTTRWFFSVQFFLLSLFLIATASIPVFAYRSIPAFVGELQKEAVGIIGQLPQEAVIEYADGKIIPHGFTLPFVFHSTDSLEAAGYPKNLIEISSEEKPSSAAVTLTPTQALIVMDGSPSTPFIYKDLFADNNGSLARDQIRSLAMDALQLIYTYRVKIALALAVASFAASIVSGLFTILLYSIVVQTIGWLLGVRIRYAQAFRFGLHIFPIALAIQLLSSLLVDGGAFPLLTVAYIAIATLILWVGRSTRPTIVLK